MSRSILFFIFFLGLASQLFAQAPTVQATDLTVNNVYCSQVTLNWTKGNGTGRIVVASKGAAVSTYPTNNSYYLPSVNYGSGAALSANEFVVYNATGNTVTIENLQKNTTYHFAVFEFSGGGSSINFLTTSVPTASVTTANITASFTIDDAYQCENVNLFNFNSNVTQTGTSTVNYKWNFGGGGTSTTANPSHTYSAYGVYDVELEVSTYRCVATYHSNDTVAPMPLANFMLDTTYPNNTQVQCFLKPDGSPNKFTFYNLIPFRPLSTPFDATEHNWKYGDGTSDIRRNGVKSYSAPGIYNVVVVSRTSKNDREFCTDSFSMTVEVKPSYVDTSLLNYDTAFCLNNNNFNFEYNIASNTQSLVWDFGDGSATASGKKVKHKYNSFGKYGFKLDVIDDNGCYAYYEDSVNVINRPSNSFSGLAPRYCLGDDPSTLTPTILGGIWQGGDVNSSGIFDPQTLGKQTIEYVVNENGCIDTTSNSTEVFAIPKFEIGNDTSICNGTNVILSIPKENTTILWSTGGTDSFTNVSTTSLVWAQRNLNGCKFRDSLTVTTINAPSVYLGNDSLLCGDGVKKIDVRASEATYIWNDGYPDEGTRSITQSGTYSVTVANKCGTATDDVELTFLPYVCDIFIPSSFSPNADGTNDIFRPSGNVEIKSMQIFNRWGEMLYESDGTTFGWDGEYQGSPVQMGHYFYIIRYLIPEKGFPAAKMESGVIYLIR